MKTMYCFCPELTLGELNHQLSEFTIHNGTYPEKIEMDKDTYSAYKYILHTAEDSYGLTFKGIPVNLNES